MLARSMTYKFAALGERVGGAKAGVRGDPADRAGRAALMARFCAEVRPANRPEDSCGAGGASRPARRTRPRIKGGQHADLGCDHVTPQRTAAADLGIGSCHAGVADLALARELLGFPEDRGWALLISIGYPADRPLTPVRQPDRRPFGEVGTAAAGKSGPGLRGQGRRQLAGSWANSSRTAAVSGWPDPRTRVRSAIIWR